MIRIKENSTALLLAVLVPAAFAAESKPAPKAPAKSAPAAKPASAPKAAPAPTATQLELKTAVEKFVAEVAEENDGLYPLNDTMSDEAWNVSLKSFDWAATRDIGGDEKLVRAVMTGQGKTFLVDFTAARDGKGWEILDEIIFSVDGVDRFTYNGKNERVPIRSAKPEDETPLETEDSETEL